MTEEMKEHVNEMKNAIGTKLIRAKEMTRADYNILRGWELPEDENGDDAGFLVEYIDGGQSNHPDFKGYISWSPFDVFANAYQFNGTLSFGHAIEYMKIGFKLSRGGWNGANMWVCITDGSTISNEFARSGAVLKVAEEGAEDITINPHFDMKCADGSITCGWTPSQTDMVANDWFVV